MLTVDFFFVAVVNGKVHLPWHALQAEHNSEAGRSCFSALWHNRQKMSLAAKYKSQI